MAERETGSAPLDIVALGEPMIEFNQRDPQRPFDYRLGFGGDTSNFAVSAARQGARVAYVTRVGRDAFGEMLLALWRDEGVDASGVAIDDSAGTGIYFVTHSAAGHAFTYYRAGSAASRMQPGDVPVHLIRRAKYLHVSGISQAISASACDAVSRAIECAREAGVGVTYDPNLRLKLWDLPRARAVICATAAKSDHFLPSLDEARTLSGLDGPEAIHDWCLALGAKAVTLKIGADGVVTGDGAKRQRIRGHQVNCVDATGAGDCFDGAFVARLAAGDSIFDATRYANAAAALTTTGYTAIAPIPRPAAVRALLARAS
ncbi:MAG TPA: sugar kinase [Casimicrobiaceae bacterium]|nr:sugar kinase [Casimicrobiaceae bacterium]